MTYFSLPERRETRWILGLFFAALLLLSRDTMYATILLGIHPSQILILGITVALGIWFLAVNRGAWHRIFTDGRMLLALAAGAVILVPMLWKRDWQLMYFSIYFAVALGIFLSYFMTSRKAAKYYTVILTALAAYSVAASYLFRIPADLGLLTVPVVKNPIGIEFYHFGLAFVPLSFVKNRNFGIFREPGMYQFFLILGLYLNNYHIFWDSPKKYWTVNIILAATLVTTFATGGLVELALLAAVTFFDKGWYRKKAGKLFAGGVVLLVAGVSVLIALHKGTLYDTVLDMLSKFDFQSESMTDRAGSILVNSKLFFAHPVFGAGLSETMNAIGNNTSSSTILYAALGVLGGTLNAAAWVCLVWRKERKWLVNLLLLLILFMSFNTENLVSNVFFGLFPAMAMAEKGIPLVKDLRRPGRRKTI